MQSNTCGRPKRTAGVPAPWFDNLTMNGIKDRLS